MSMTRFLMTFASYFKTQHIHTASQFLPLTPIMLKSLPRKHFCITPPDPHLAHSYYIFTVIQGSPRVVLGIILSALQKLYLTLGGKANTAYDYIFVSLTQTHGNGSVEQGRGTGLDLKTYGDFAYDESGKAMDSEIMMLGW